MRNKFTTATVLLIILSMIGFYQCTNNEDLFGGFPIIWDFENIQEVHDTMTINDTVQFEIEDPTIENIFEGPRGTRLILPPNSYGTGTETPPIFVDLIEVYKRGDIIRHNIQTFTGQTPLVSAGMIWVRVTDSSGNDLNLDGVNAVMPKNTDADGYEDAMAHFISTFQNVPAGPVTSWTAGNSNVSYSNANGGEYTLTNITTGWNHAGADYSLAPNELTKFAVQIPGVNNFDLTQVFFVDKDNTIVSCLPTETAGSLQTYESSVKIGAGGKIMAISLQEGSLYFGAQTVQINGDDLFELEVESGTVEQLETLLDSMDVFN